MTQSTQQTQVEKEAEIIFKNEPKTENTSESNQKDNNLNEKVSHKQDFKSELLKDSKFYYLLQCPPDFLIIKETARKNDAKAVFTAAGWVYQDQKDAEYVYKRCTQGNNRKLNVVRWYDKRLDDIWFGSKTKARLAKKSISLEIDTLKSNKKRQEIILQCHLSPLHPSWLYAEAENIPEDLKKEYEYFKPIWDKACKEKEEIDLRQADLAREEEDIEKDLEKPLAESNLPEIEIIPGEIHELTNKAENLLEKNASGIYQRGGRLVRVVQEKTKPNKSKRHKEIKRSGEALLIAEVDPTHVCELLSKLAKWVRFDERTQDLKQKDCPDKIARTLISRREWDLPVLVGIIQAPTLREDGSILEKPGYDEETGLFFNPGKTNFLPIPVSPSKDDAIDALNIVVDILKDFPFENNESRSVSISAILTGLIRKSIRTAPLHGYTSPKMGTGKSLLADIVGLIATGQTNTVIPHAENEAEEKKRLLAVLSEGDPIICFDNIERPFGSPSLCSVLTQENFKDRLLGVNRSLSVPTNSTFLATGNNLTFIGDISTRAILCRLDPQCEKPEERFFETDLKKYIPENRGKLVQACLTILRAYHIAGRPKQKIAQFGRFEDWSDWVRSALVWLGLEDPCKSRKEIENADPVRVALGSFLASWYASLGNLSYTTKKVIEKAKEHHPELLEALKEIAPDRNNSINSRSLGNTLASFKGRIENSYRLEYTGVYQNAATWRVIEVKE